MKALQAGLIPALVLAFSLGTGMAYAQTAPAPTAPAATTPMKKMVKPAVPADQKAAVSKSCSASADKQGLKGKARKAYREKCKHAGGPTM